MHFNETDAEEHDIPVVARYRGCEPIWIRRIGGKTVPMLKDATSGNYTWFLSNRLDGDLVYSPANSVSEHQVHLPR